MSKKVIVIGAGLGGLAISALLAKRGFEVELIEQNSSSGGKAGELFLQSKLNPNHTYRFDTGPSLFSLLAIWQNLYRQLGYNFEELNSLVEVTVGAKYFWGFKDYIQTYPDIKKFGIELEEKTKDNSNKLLGFLKDTKNQWDTCSDLFLFSQFSFGLVLKKQFWKSLVKLPQAKLFQKMGNSLDKYFDDPKTRQIFARMATYNGSSPYQTSALFNLITQIEYGNEKQYTPIEGIYQLTRQLTNICKELGVKITYNSKLLAINCIDNKVENIQVKVNNKETKTLKADMFVSNIDYYTTQKILDITAFKSPSTDKLSMSSLIFYWGINHNFSELVSHNLLCSQNYKQEFQQILQGIIPEDPTIYIAISSLITKNDAPKGHQNWFVMINLPVGIKLNEIQIKELKLKVIKKVESTLNINNFQQYITCEKSLNPQEIEAQTGSYLGSLYGLNSDSMLNAFYRPKSKDRKLNNLYYTGGSVHPGGGMPLAVQSAILLNEIIT